MAAIPELGTERLRLRAWQEADREPFAALNADPVVMEYFPEPLDRARSDALIERLECRLRAQRLRALGARGAGHR